MMKVSEFCKNALILNGCADGEEDSQIRSYLEPDHTFEDFNKYLTNAIRYGNIGLFKNFLLEITHFFFNTESKNHTSAFLHLYRALELISYSFPLYYASKSKSYHGTYNKLKDFFKSGGDGERAFLKDFVNNHLFRNEPSLDTRLSIKFTSSNPIIQRQHFDVTLKIANSPKSGIEILDNTEYSEIVTKRRSLISLMIATRNRHFHLLEGDFQENITSVESYYFDDYFKDLNMIFCNWIAQIFFKILHSAIEQEK
ncbi:MAG: hypothetical protein ACKVTZ_07795 [Bacteroidia bacterium]